MDSDAKEFGHLRAADRKTVWAYQRKNVIIHSCVGNSTPNRKFACGSRVNSRSQSTPTRALSNRPQSRTNESLVCGLSKNAGLRRPVWVKLCHGRISELSDQPQPLHAGMPVFADDDVVV